MFEGIYSYVKDTQRSMKKDLLPILQKIIHDDTNTTTNCERKNVSVLSLVE